MFKEYKVQVVKFGVRKQFLVVSQLNKAVVSAWDTLQEARQLVYNLNRNSRVVLTKVE